MKYKILQKIFLKILQSKVTFKFYTSTGAIYKSVSNLCMHCIFHGNTFLVYNTRRCNIYVKKKTNEIQGLSVFVLHFKYYTSITTTNKRMFCDYTSSTSWDICCKGNKLYRTKTFKYNEIENLLPKFPNTYLLKLFIVPNPLLGG